MFQSDNETDPSIPGVLKASGFISSTLSDFLFIQIVIKGCNTDAKLLVFLFNLSISVTKYGIISGGLL